MAKLAGVDAHDVVQIGGGSHDIDVRRSLFLLQTRYEAVSSQGVYVQGIDMWPAITGANRTNPRPVLPTSQWSLLSAEGNNRMLKLITSAYRTNWFLPNGERLACETSAMTRREC